MNHVIGEHHVEMKMRDGTVLRANVYRPDVTQRVPVILVRSPYGDPAMRPQHIPLVAVIDAGCALVIQDCRGCFTSEGIFDPFNEERDGVDSVQWCSDQPWSSGAVAMMGRSYLGTTQLMAALGQPAGLRAIAPFVAPSDAYDGRAYSGGALALGSTLYWYVGIASSEIARRRRTGGEVGDEAARLATVANNLAGAYRTLPLAEMPGVSEIVPEWDATLSHPSRDDYWQARSIRDRHGDISVPGLHVGGWYDLFLRGVLENYTGLSRGAATAHARRNQRLVIGPWIHGLSEQAVAAVDFGPSASAAAIGLDQMQLDFLLRHVHDEAAESTGQPVKIFVMGANVWRDEPSWPLDRSVPTRMYLRHDGGLTSGEPSPREEVSRFVFDPRDPVPTVGGATLLAGSLAAFNAGPRDQALVESRPDVLIFTSEVLDRDIEVTGYVRVVLNVASSAVDTDFTAKLVDVWVDDRAICVTDGILRMRYRRGTTHPELIQPGEIYEIRIDLVATSLVFLAGHRVRVEISSSNFPRFDRNPNNGQLSAECAEGDLVVAEQSIFHDASRRSFIELPVVPR